MASWNRTIAKPGEVELIVKKSRFICTVDRAGSEEDARAKRKPPRPEKSTADVFDDQVIKIRAFISKERAALLPTLDCPGVLMGGFELIELSLDALEGSSIYTREQYAGMISHVEEIAGKLRKLESEAD